MRGCGRKRACVYTRERTGRVSEAGEQNGRVGGEMEREGGVEGIRGVVHGANGGGRALKKRGLGRETREEGKESPQVFDL